MFGKKPEPFLTLGAKSKYFMTAYWRGVLVVLTPFLLIPVLLPLPAEKYQWVLYVLIMMALFWVTECIPLAVTSFLPVLFFPLSGVMSTKKVCECYCSDAVLMFLGSIFLAFSVEQSGFHKRLAYFAVRSIGYSHYKLLFAMCAVTTFASMWITNTAATTMMVPIIQALLKVFEEQKVLKMYERDADGNEVASDFTVVYFCAATYSATIGGIGTLVGTGTNLVFKGFYVDEYKNAPEYLSFPLFSAFGAPMMLFLEAFLYLCLVITYFGFGRPSSAHAKRIIITPQAKDAAKRTIDEAAKKLGRLTFWEIMVIILFGGAMIAFFCRSPQIFPGWGDIITKYHGIPTKPTYIKDSSLAMLVAFLMLLLPSNLSFFKNFTAKYHEDLPKGPVTPVLNWRVVNVNMPFSFMFLLGGGFALSTASKSSGLNDKIGEQLRALKPLPNYVILFMLILVVILVTNFASNIAVCNVFTPISMQMANEIGQDPLWYNIASGFSASFCFMLPVGTPGNLVVQGKARVATAQMIKAGFGVTITTIIITWVFMCFWAPVVWPSMKTYKPPP